MNSDNRRPSPLYPPRARKRCPVCDEISYSAAGIHPQCAVRQADPNSGKTKPKANAPAIVNSSELERWQKACPACRAANHVRQKVCACGHTFT